MANQDCVNELHSESPIYPNKNDIIVQHMGGTPGHQARPGNLRLKEVVELHVTRTTWRDCKSNIN